jgi:hypothetical protein
MSTRDLAIRHLGIYDVMSYETLKRFYMRLGEALPRALLERVDGRVGERYEECDGVTSLGRWEFCLQRNTKNKAGAHHDLQRCPDHCVQILGVPNPGWMSGHDFLQRHGVDGQELGAIVDRVANAVAIEARQLSLPV